MADLSLEDREKAKWCSSRNHATREKKIYNDLRSTPVNIGSDIYSKVNKEAPLHKKK